MDTPTEAKTAETKTETAPVVLPSLDTMEVTIGFDAFLERFGDRLDWTEENREVLAKRYRLFGAMKTVGHQYEVAMNKRLGAENKGRMTREERAKYDAHLEELAVVSPGEFKDLEEDLAMLEGTPSEIRQKKAEVERLSQDLAPEKQEALKADLEKLNARKATLEKAKAEAEAKVIPPAKGWRGWVGEKLRKKSLELDKTNYERELKGVTDAVVLITKMLEDPKRYAELTQEIAEAESRIEQVKQKVLYRNAFAEMIRERLLGDAQKECESARTSTDFRTLQKAVQTFIECERAWNEKGIDYLEFTDNPRYAEEYKHEIDTRVHDALFSAILQAVKETPADSIEKALSPYIASAKEGLGFATKEGSVIVLLDMLQAAEREVPSGSGKATKLHRLITKESARTSRTV